MESLETLQRLAANPFYRMTRQQVNRLHALLAEQQRIQHNPGFRTHPTDFAIHPTEPPRQDGNEAV